MNWIKSIQTITEIDLLSLLNDCDILPKKIKDRALQSFRQHQQKIKEGQWIWSPSVLSFIPNVIEFRRLENYR
jgi:hypothetical protein